jgi:kynureninase
MSDDPLLAWRKSFPILDRCAYLLTHSLGAMHASVPVSLAEFTGLGETRGACAWEEAWLPRVRETADAIGSLLGAPEGSVALHQNVTALLGIVASCLTFPRGRNRVVFPAPDFSTLRYVWTGQERFGAEPVAVASRDGVGVETEDMLEAIDERTSLVALSHVLFKSSYLMDVPSIVRRARQVGARVLLDIYQSAGTVPIDLVALDVDFAVGGSVKWLCGGPGACYLYVKPDLSESLEPAQRGWFSHARPFAFEEGFSYADGAMRFMGGSPGVPALYSCRPGIEAVRSVGIERIREKSLRQTARIVGRSRDHGLKVCSPLDPQRRGGTVTIACPDGERVTREMIEAGVMVDHRSGAGIRIGPHFYTMDAECDRAVDEIARRSADRPERGRP